MKGGLAPRCLQSLATEYDSAYESDGRIEYMNDWRRKMSKSGSGLDLGVVGGNREDGLHVRSLEAWMRTCLASKGILERSPVQILPKRDPCHTQK